jgi:hypothetical protein
MALNPNQKTHYCSAALLSERVVVTAAHCVISEGNKSPSLKFALQDLWVAHPGVDFSSGSYYYRVRVAKIVTHPDYTNVYKPEIGDLRTQIDDIAFLFLEKPMIKNYQIQVATEDEINGAILNKDIVEHFGYGFQSKNVQDGRPWSTRLPLVSGSSLHLKEDRVLFTKEGVSALCPGDSGGPWYLDINGVKKIAAVTVAASGCRNDPPYLGTSLGTRIYPYLDLMRQEWRSYEQELRTYEGLREKAIVDGTYFEAKECLKLETNAELLYQTQWGYWVNFPNPVGWIQNSSGCPNGQNYKPWVSIPLDFQSKMRWRFWDLNQQAYSKDFTLPKNRNSAGQQKTYIKCVKGRKIVKIESSKELKCPKGYNRLVS